MRDHFRLISWIKVISIQDVPNVESNSLLRLIPATSAMAAILVATGGGTVWVLDHFKLKEAWGTEAYFSVATLGVVIPALVFSLAWAIYSEIVKHKLTQQNAKLAQEKADIERYLKGINFSELAVHFLSECFRNVMWLAVEMRNERGPNYIKAKDRHCEALRVLVSICRERYVSDKLLLQRGLSNHDSVPLRKYTELKEKLFDLCDEIDRLLSARTTTHPEARAAIESAGSRLRNFIGNLDIEINRLTFVDNRRPNL